jgi:hypothetical protein
MAGRRLKGGQLAATSSIPPANSSLLTMIFPWPISPAAVVLIILGLILSISTTIIQYKYWPELGTGYVIGNIIYALIFAYFMYFVLRGVSSFRIILQVAVIIGFGVLLITAFATTLSITWYICAFLLLAASLWLTYQGMLDYSRGLQRFVS